ALSQCLFTGGLLLFLVGFVLRLRCGRLLWWGLRRWGHCRKPLLVASQHVFNAGSRSRLFPLPIRLKRFFLCVRHRRLSHAGSHFVDRGSRIGRAKRDIKTRKSFAHCRQVSLSCQTLALDSPLLSQCFRSFCCAVCLGSLLLRQIVLRNERRGISRRRLRSGF